MAIRAEGTDPRVDRYIADAAPFAQPILRHLRALIHEACPEVRETIKWNFPHFDLPRRKGRQGHGTLCSMAAFTGHCTLGFWNAPEVVGDAVVDGAMGEFGRIASLEDLPDDDILRGYVRRAAELREQGVTMTPPRKDRPPPETPEDLLEALAANPKAQKAFEDFPPSHRREYVEWVEEAKRESTRLRRIRQTVEWVAQGKDRNWKYR